MRLRRAELATALLITAFAVALHVLRALSAGPLWRDEVAALNLATSATWAEVVANHGHESFPPPFFFLVRTWVAVAGSSDASLRGLGLANGLLLLVALWLSARSSRTGPPLLVLALVAIQPWSIVYGDGVRGYGLATTALVAVFASFSRLHATPSRRARLAAGLAAIAAAQLAFLSWPLLFAVGFAGAARALIERDRRALLALVGIGLATAASVAPWIPAMSTSGEGRLLLRVSPDLSETVAALADTAGGPASGLALVWLALGAVALWPRFGAGESPAASEGAPSPLSAPPASFWRFALPALALAQIGFLHHLGYPPRPWYFLAFLTLAALHLDALLASSPARRLVRLAATALAFLALAIPATHLVQLRMSNLDLVARRVGELAAPGDLVVVSPWYLGITFARYHRSPATWTTVPSLADHDFHRFEQFRQRMREADPLAPVRTAIEQTLRSGHRVFWVGELQLPPPGTQPAPIPPAPHPRWGWDLTPYQAVWGLEMGALLRDHVVAGQPLAPARSGHEDADLVLLEGWRERPTLAGASPPPGTATAVPSP